VYRLRHSRSADAPGALTLLRLDPRGTDESAGEGRRARNAQYGQTKHVSRLRRNRYTRCVADDDDGRDRRSYAPSMSQAALMAGNSSHGG